MESPVGFAELEHTTGTCGDRPPVFVDEPVVKPAEEDQIVQIRGSSLGPMDNMMDL